MNYTSKENEQPSTNAKPSICVVFDSVFGYHTANILQIYSLSNRSWEYFDTPTNIQMNNLNLRFLDATLSPIANKKVVLSPINPPNISASYLSMGDPEVFYTDVTGSLTGSIVSNIYSAVLAKPLPESKFYIQANESSSAIYSGSVLTGNAQIVYFNLIDFIKIPEAARKITLTPATVYPLVFSGSVITLSSTSSFVDSTGSITYPSLVPYIIEVQVYGEKNFLTDFYISVPGFPDSRSIDGSWNAKDLLIVKPSKGLAVKLNNADSSFVLTVSSSDARYASRFYATTSLESSSYANHADTASYILAANINGTVLSSSYSLSSSFARNSISSSYALTSSYSFKAVSSSYAPSSDASLSSSYALSASHADNSDLSLQSISSSYSLSSSYALSASHADKSDSALESNHSILSDTASLAIDALNSANAVNAAFADVAQWSWTALSSSYAVDSSNADISSLALESISSSYSLLADTASLALFAIQAQDSFFAGAAVTAFVSLTSHTASWSWFANSSSISLLSDTASYIAGANVDGIVDSASYAVYSDTSLSASYAPGNPSISASYALTASFASNYVTTADSASHADIADNAINSISASHANEADHCIFADTASYVLSASYNHYVAFSDFSVSASHADRADLADNATNAVNSISSSYATTARTASYSVLSLNSISASYALNASFSNTASYTIDGITIDGDQEITGEKTFTNPIFVDVIFDENAVNSINLDNGYLYKNGAPSANFLSKNLFDNTGDITLNWNTRDLFGQWDIDGLTGSLYGNSKTSTSSSFASSSISSSYALSSSYSITASYATSISFVPATASYSLLAATSSYNLTSSYLTSFEFNRNIASALSSSVSVVSQRSIGSYVSVYYNYTVIAGSSQRAGIIFGTWNGGNVEYAEVSTITIGDTSAINLSIDITGGNVRLIATVVGSPDWTVRSFGTYL